MDAASSSVQPALDDLDMLNILSHPIVATRVSELRSKTTTAKRFRELLSEVTTSLGMEASKTLDLNPVEGLASPIGPYTGWPGSLV